MKTKKLVICAMLAAMCAVLGYIAIDLNSIKITFESLPVLLGALLYGPAAGTVIGTIGTLIYQLLRYGVSATTLLWILPYSLYGLSVGWAAKQHHFEVSGKRLMLVIVLNELMVTLLNTGVIYVDSKIYGWYYPYLILGSLALRLGVCVVKALVFTGVTPLLLKLVKNRRPVKTDTKGEEQGHDDEESSHCGN